MTCKRIAIVRISRVYKVFSLLRVLRYITRQLIINYCITVDLPLKQMTQADRLVFHMQWQFIPNSSPMCRVGYKNNCNALSAIF